MRILSHRGYWMQSDEKNTMAAFRRSFELGFGIETDIRDHAGELLIAHDIPRGDEPRLVDVLALWRETSCTGPLALNIKADGLQAQAAQALVPYPELEHFYFDMSIPDTLGWARQGSPFYLRLSEYEPVLAPIAGCAGIWLDAFEACWYDARLLGALLDRHPVCVVSAELHKRAHLPHWEFLAASGLSQHAGLSLCTDLPLDARAFFHAL